MERREELIKKTEGYLCTHSPGHQSDAQVKKKPLLYPH